MTDSSLSRDSRPLGRWLVVLGVLLVLILGPFFLWEEAITGWSLDLISGGSGKVLVASLVAGFLAFDVVLPVPSSILSTTAGFQLGVVVGAGVTWLGMTLGCGLAYAIGSRVGHGPMERFVGPRALAHTASVMQTKAIWVLAVFRPVPVLAEASVLLAGATRIPFGTFFRVTALANLGTALAYAWVGARSADVGSFLLAFLGASLLPGVAYLVAATVVRPSSEGS